MCSADECDGQVVATSRWHLPLKRQKFAGWEGRFTPADSHRQASGGKPPFPTCELLLIESEVCH
jgi:hypothetical protein